MTKWNATVVCIGLLAVGVCAQDQDATPFYGKVGVQWTNKATTTYSGIETVSKVHYEVISLDEEHQLANVRMQSVTIMAGAEFKGEPIMTGMSLAPVSQGSGNTEGHDGSVETRDETITVAAGEFSCRVTEVTSPGSTSTSWMSVEHYGLMVKQVTTAAGSSVTTELESLDLGE